MVAAAGALEMTGGQRVELEGLARSHTAPAREVRQAEALLWATDGVSNAEIARRCATTPKSVRRWRRRFAAEGTAAVGRIMAGHPGRILVGVLGGAAAGAAAGGLVGALVDVGVTEEEARYYDRELQSGRAIVTVNSHGRYKQAAEVLRNYGT